MFGGRIWSVAFPRTLPAYIDVVDESVVLEGIGAGVGDHRVIEVKLFRAGRYERGWRPGGATQSWPRNRDRYRQRVSPLCYPLTWPSRHRPLRGRATHPPEGAARND